MILVTGGTGLVGSHLLHDLLKKGLRVRALRRKESNVEVVRKVFSYYSDNSTELFSKIEWIEGDLLDVFSLAEAMEGVTHAYHCAAMVSLNSKDRDEMIYNNVTGTANFVNVALENKIQKLCYVSSVAALGTEKGKDITEETDWNSTANASAYTVSKHLSENEVWRASEEGLNVVIINPTIVIGPGNWNRSSGIIFKTANKGLGWYPGGGMGYVDVRDTVKTMVLIMESEIKNEKFIVSSENISFRKFMELVHSSLGKQLPNKKAGKLILELAWRVEILKSRITGSTPVFTKDAARHAAARRSYSNAKIKKALNIDFLPVVQTVKDTAKWFLLDHNLTKKK